MNYRKKKSLGNEVEKRAAIHLPDRQSALDLGSWWTELPAATAAQATAARATGCAPILSHEEASGFLRITAWPAGFNWGAHVGGMGVWIQGHMCSSGTPTSLVDRASVLLDLPCSCEPTSLNP